MAIEQATFDVPAELAGRIDKCLRHLSGRSWSETRGMLRQGCVYLNSVVCQADDAAVKAGDRITLRQDPNTRYRAPTTERESSGFQMVHLDDDLLVVDKSAHLLTVPTERHEKNTLLEGVNRFLRRRQRGGATVVQRLDRGTSGLLVFARRPQIGKALQEQFASHHPERGYVAIVAGTKLQPPAGSFISKLGTTASLQRFVAETDDDEGETAVTHYKVERTVRHAMLVRVRLETGRRHQIRVQFAEAGHPVLGDDRYLPHVARHPAWKAKRLALHAELLGFQHPTTGQAMHFESPLPAEFTRFLAAR